MVTAPTTKNADEGADSVSVGCIGGVATETAGGALSCHAFCELAGGVAGGAGTGGAGVATQQVGVEQLVKSQPVQQQRDFVPRASAPGRVLAMMIPCPARNIPSRNTTTVRTSRDLMALGRFSMPILTHIASPTQWRKVIPPLASRTRTCGFPFRTGARSE